MDSIKTYILVQLLYIFSVVFSQFSRKLEGFLFEPKPKKLIIVLIMSQLIFLPLKYTTVIHHVPYLKLLD